MLSALVIDPSPGDRNLVLRLLASAGVQARAVSSTLEVTSRDAAHRPDVLLVRLTEAQRMTLRSFNAWRSSAGYDHTPLVVLSELSRDDLRLFARGMNASGTITTTRNATAFYSELCAALHITPILTPDFDERDMTQEELLREILTGVPWIDQDHVFLFRIITNLQRQVEQGTVTLGEIRELIGTLHVYTQHHFAVEEDVMRVHKYVNLDEHIVNHGTIRESVVLCSELVLRDDFSPRVLTEIVPLLHRWLRTHIGKHDRHFVESCLLKAS